MPNLLIDNQINRVDLVSEGSCSVADILILKGKDGVKMGDELKKAREAAMNVVDKIAKSEYQTPIKDYIEAVEKACNETQKKLDQAEEDKKNAEADANKAKDDLAKANTDLAKAKEDLKNAENVEKSKEPTEEEILKSMPEPAKTLFLEMKKAKEAQDAEIAKAKDEKEQAEAVAKAKELAVLPANQDTLVGIIKSKPSKEIMTLLENIAKAAENSDLFKSAGSDAQVDLDTLDARAQVEELAKAKIAADPTLNIAKARFAVYKEKPELYAKISGGEK